MRVAVTAVVVLQAALSSQTFIVDASNGPGTNFTSLPAAAAAVPDGAVLLVRTGNYAGFLIAQKGLVVLGDTGVTISGTIEVRGTSSQQAFVLRNVSWPTPPQFAPCLRLTSCAGPVVLERLGNAAWPNNIPFEPQPFDMTNCDQLVLRESTFSGYMTMDGVTGAIERCNLSGLGRVGFAVPRWTTPGINARASDLQVVESIIRGGDGYGGMAGGTAASPGIFMVTNSSVRVLASTVSGGSDGYGPRFAIAGGSVNARIDPTTVLQGGVQPWGVTVQFLPMPRLTALGAPPGGTLQASVDTEVGDLVILVVGLPGAPTTSPGFQDAFWLDPVVHVYQAIGVQQQTSPISGSITVPNSPGFAGIYLTWHAACFGPVTGQQNTSPGISLVH